MMNELELKLSQIENFQFVHQNLFISAQPTAEELLHIKEYGVSTILNIALSDSAPHLDAEDKICTELGLNYVQLPLSFDMPSADQAILLLDLIDYLVKQQQVWLHGSNSFKVSSLIYLYRQYYLDMDMPTAMELLHSVWEPNSTWTGLIHAVGLQLQGRKATQELEIALIRTHHFT